MMYRMTNPIRAYDWGSRTAMSERFAWPAPSQPQAEMWMGAHSAAPSTITAGSDIPLDAFLRKNPKALGGDSELPFLLKVLAAEQPLSIQTHPSQQRAAAGYAAENAAGISADAAHRTYRDPHHKPELIVALSDFAALCGFRPAPEACAELRALRLALEQSRWREPYAEESSASGSTPLTGPLPFGVFDQLIELVENEDYAGALDFILRSHRESCSAIASALASVLTSQAVLHTLRVPEAALQARKVVPESSIPLPDVELSPTTFDTLARAAQFFPGDPGILVTLLMNRADLTAGEALYLPAGNLHAYLHGFGVEVMANSDNVLRGGLTSKHTDVGELLAVTQCEVLPIPYCQPERLGLGCYNYRPEFDEFQLARFEFPEAGSHVGFQHKGAAVLLCTAGELHVDSTEGEHPYGERGLRLSAGQSVFLPAGESIVTLSHGGVDTAQAFLALPGRVPLSLVDPSAWG